MKVLENIEMIVNKLGYTMREFINEYLHIKKNILEDHISEEYWWKGQDKKKFHVRPKAQKSTDLAPTPSGKWAKKFCYWFNNDYVKQIVNNNGSK